MMETYPVTTAGTGILQKEGQILLILNKETEI